MKNPFIFGKIVEKDEFCNRENELQFLKQQIKNNYSVWLYSPRRYGKTSLLLKTFSEIESIKTVYVDLYNVKTIDEFSRKYANALVNTLFNWKQDLKKLTNNIIKIFTNFSPKLSFDGQGIPSLELGMGKIDEQMDIEKLLNIPEKIGLNENIQICIAFDEFQEVNRFEPFLVNWMRSAFQTQKTVSYIFLGSKQSLMENIFAHTKSPFYEFGIKMNIEPINSNDWMYFINTKFEKSSLSINEETIEGILEKSKGHPHFTQYFSSVVWDLINAGEKQKSKNFQKLWLGRIIAGQSIIFQNILDQLNINQRNVLSALADSDKKIELFSKSVRNQFDLPSSSTLTVAVDGLIKKDLIQKGDGHYELVNPIFREWVKKL